jgi:ornithine--oxo-acid transaminase
MDATGTSASQAYIGKEARYGARNYAPVPVVVDHAKDCLVWDVEGREYIDMMSAYSSVSHGHLHPRIVAAAQRQMEKVAVMSRAYYSTTLGPLLEKLSEVTGFERALPMNTGAEAVETALKTARKWAYKVKGVPEGKAEILAFSNNFHGRTITIVSFSTEADYRDGFGPFTPGFRVLPYGDADAVEAAMHENVAAVLVEPIQGEAGIVSPPAGYLARLREITQRHNALLMVDEIQSGLGRTGKLFAFEHEGIRPDVVIVGKALSGGCYPVSGILADEPVMGVFKPGEHGSTYGGNPMAAAIAQAALRVLVEERMVENSAELGPYFLERLRQIPSQHVKEVRGKGLWIGIELHREAGGARRFCEALQHEGLLCKETHEHVIRIAPPLVIKKEEIDWAVERLEKVLTTL